MRDKMDKNGNAERIHHLSAQLMEAQNELLFLRQKFCQLEFLSARPILNVPEELQAGYLLLDSDERQFTALALCRHGEFVSLWYRYLSLMRDAIYSANENREASELSIRDQLAMRFIAVASGTAKLILDSGLAGYYTQSFTLTRHLFETWFRLEYIRMRPEEANKWFLSQDGALLHPPNENRIHSYVEKHATGNVKKIATQVKKKISELNKMSHPTENTFQQTESASPDTLKFGANYVPDLCVGVLHEGASALRFILHALDDVLPQSSQWKESLDNTVEDQEKVLAREKCRLNGVEQPPLTDQE